MIRIYIHGGFSWIFHTMLVYWSYSRVKKRPFLQRGQQWTARRHVIWPWMRRMQVSDLVVAQPFYLVNWRESQQKLYSMSIPNCTLHPQLGLCSPQKVVICSYDFHEINWFPPMKQARSFHQSGVEIGNGIPCFQTSSCESIRDTLW